MDYNLVCLVSGLMVGMGGVMVVVFFGSYGLIDFEFFDKICVCVDYYFKMVLVVLVSFWCLMDGIEVEIGGWIWCCIVGYGYVFEYISLYCDEVWLLILGDMVLLCILINVFVVDVEFEVDLFNFYFDLLVCYLVLLVDMFVLFLYGKFFRGLYECID